MTQDFTGTFYFPWKPQGSIREKQQFKDYGEHTFYTLLDPDFCKSWNRYMHVNAIYLLTKQNGIITYEQNAGKPSECSATEADSDS